MDTSEQYIKMCDCEEIQGQNPHKDFLDGYKYSTVNGIAIITGTWFFTGGNWANAIWLPRQDQLQEMLELKSVPIQSVAWVGYLLCLLRYDFARKSTSMEQLWLAFVMKEKFKKTWDGKGWR